MDWASIANITEADVQGFMKYWYPGVGAVLGLVLAIEILIRTFSWWTHRNTDTPRDLISKDAPANFALSIHARIIDGTIGVATVLAATTFGSKLSHWHIPFNLYTLPLYFLAAEFYHYIYHRLGHEVRILWADHSIHHSSRDYEFFTSWRLPPGTFVYKCLTIVPIAMLGFGPVGLTMMAYGIAFQTFIHTQRIGRLGWFDYVFCSPTNHSIHHACNARYIDKNYGGMTMIWDVLLGTFILPEKEKIKFGITRDVNSHDPFKIWAFEFGHLGRDFIHAPTWGRKLNVLLGRPGETFSYKGRKDGSKGGEPGGYAGVNPALVPAE